MSLAAFALAAMVSGWTDSFATLNLNRWTPATGRFERMPNVVGEWRAQNVYLNDPGILVLEMDTSKCNAGFCVKSGRLITDEMYGFGTYTFRARMATSSYDLRDPGVAVPGNVSSFFTFVNDSETEIDIEIEGRNPSGITAGTYLGLQRREHRYFDTTDLSKGFNTYAFDWEPSSITFYVNGVAMWKTTKHVPQRPAHVYLSLGPSNDPLWGGTPHVGSVYMVVSSVAYRPSR